MTLPVPLTSMGAWILSMVIHASGLCVAILFAAEFSVVPRVAPFRWDVTLIPASPSEPFSSDKPIPTLASQAPVRPASDDLSWPPATPAVHRIPAASRSLMKPAVPSTDGHMPRGPLHHGSVQAGTLVKDSTDVPGPSAEPSPQESNAESSNPAAMVWPVTNSTPAEMPPPALEGSDQSNMAMEPSVQEAPRLVPLPAPQFRPTPVFRRTQPDYGWLAGLLTTEVEQIKRYPAQAKWHRWQGNVVVQAVIREDGRISDIQVVESSGHDALDHDAIALLERISPMQLPYPLDQSSIIVRIPIGYRLE